MKFSSFVAVISIGCLLIVNAGCSNEESLKKEEKKTVHLERAMKFVELEDYQSAEIEFKNALQADPVFPKARYQLALMYLKKQQPAKAVQEFSKAIESDPKNWDAHLKLAELLFLAKRPDESKLLIEKILKENNKHVDAMSLMAQILMSKGDKENAQKQINKAIEIEPSNARLYLAKAEIYTGLKNFSEAELALHKALDLEPDNPKYNESIVKFYIAQNKREKAIEIIKDIISRKPGVPSLYIILSQLYESGKQYDKAEASLKSVIEVDPKNYTSYLLMGNYYNRHKKYEDAENFYNKAYINAKNTDQSLESKGILADFYLSRQQLEQAKKAVEEILKNNPEHRVGNLLKARVLTGSQQYKRALALLLEKFKGDEFEYDKAVAFIGVGELKNAEKAAMIAKEKNKQDDRPQALLAQIALLNGDPASAEKMAAESLKMNINNYNAALTLGKALAAQGHYEKALRHFSQMNTFDPKNVEIMLNMGIAQLSLKKDKDAEKTFEEILSLKPDYFQALSYLARIFNNRRNLAGAVHRVESQIKKVPNNVAFVMLLGKLQFDCKTYADALSTFRKAQDLSPDSVEAAVMAAKTLARMGEHKKVIGEYRVLIEKKPELKTAYVKLGTLMEQNGDSEGAKKIYEKALQKFPGYGPAANNLACLLMADPKPDLDKAIIYASTARSYDSEDPYASDTMGWALHQRGSFLAASSHLQHAVSKLSDSPTVLYHYALNLKETGSPSQAIKMLEKSLALSGDFPEKKDAVKLINDWKKSL